jgi:hypothetical protein
MNQEIIPFKFQEHEVNTIMIDGKPYWIGTAICGVLGIKDVSSAFRRLDDDEKGKDFFPTPGGSQEKVIVNESGLYSLIMGSHKAIARPFKRWITHEVIPSIRKTGAYIHPAADMQKMIAGAIAQALPAVFEAIQPIIKSQVEAAMMAVSVRVKSIEVKQSWQESIIQPVKPKISRFKPISLQTQLVEIIKQYAWGYMQSDYAATWAMLYHNFRLHTGISLVARGEARGMQPIDVAEQDGLMPDLLDFAKELFRRN